MNTFRRWILIGAPFITATVCACASGSAPPIKVGVLHSLTGTMAISESPVVDATLLVIDEINEAGGVLGRMVEPIVVDGGSDVAVFAAAAERLIVDDEVAAIFGVWTSEHRKAVKPVVEELDALLFYPVQYEGIEQSPNIVYAGAAPNQQITPAVQWSHKFLGPRMFLVGSDYVFPRVANEIIKDRLADFGLEPVGEEYAVLGSTDFDDIVRKIKAAEPDVILSTINGDSNIAFFQSLLDAGITPHGTPVMSFSIGEVELQSLGADDLAGNYSAWNYFQSIDSAANDRFVDAFQEAHGADRVVSDPMESAYNSVRIWAGAVESAGATDTAAVRAALANRTLSAPQGNIRIDAGNQHLWQAARIGRARPDGQFDIEWETGEIVPEPFPDSRTEADWERILDDLYEGWGDRWANPTPP